MCVRAENLLQNADFEEVNAESAFPGWELRLEAGTYAGVADIPALEGKNCLKLSCPEVLKSGAVVQRCKVEPGKEYLFSGLFYGRNAFARINCHDSDGKFIGCAVQFDLTSVDGVYTWCPLSQAFVPKENTAYVEVVFDMWARICKGDCYADHLYLGAKPSGLPAMPEPSAALENGCVKLHWEPCENAKEYLVYKSAFPEQGTGESVALVSGTA